MYIHVGHAVIDTAMRLGVKLLEMGLTTDSIKQNPSARVAPIQLLIDLFVAPVYQLLNRAPVTRHRSIFK